jgi:hypothetical protein
MKISNLIGFLVLKVRERLLNSEESFVGKK